MIARPEFDFPAEQDYQEGMDFKTSLDPLAKGMTAGAFAIFGVLSLSQVYSYLRSPREMVDLVAMAVTIAIFAGLLLSTYSYSPLGYSVLDGALVIHRPWKPVVIPLEEIRTVRLVAPEEVRIGLRAFGVGGLFGYYGLFFFPRLGGYVRFYLRNKQNPVLLDTARGKLLLSPDSPGLVPALTAARG
jgi:hypothetical protein